MDAPEGTRSVDSSTAGWDQIRLWLRYPVRAVRWSACINTFLGLGTAVVRASAAALFLTLLTYFATNLFLRRSVEKRFETLRLPALKDCQNAAQATEKFTKQLGWADMRIEEWLRQSLGSDPSRQHVEQLLDFLDHIAGTNDKARPRRKETLHRLLTGNQRVRLLGTLGVGASSVSAREMFDELTGDPNDQVTKMLDQDPEKLGPLKRKFLEQHLAGLATEMAGPLRELRRWNGSVQWATFLVAWLVAWLAFQRWLLVRQLEHCWLPTAAAKDLPANSEPAAAHELDAVLRQMTSQRDSGADAIQLGQSLGREFGELRDGVEDDVYGTFQFLIGVLPALGFIGTIIGMGSALLAADGLFGAADPQRAVSEITQQLGFAFDTTLVALLAGIATGIWIAIVRIHERRFLKSAEDALADRFDTIPIRESAQV